MSRSLASVVMVVFVLSSICFAGKPDISGLVQAQYVDRRGQTSDFDLKAARLKFAAEVIDRLSVMVQVDFARDPGLLDAMVNFSFSEYANVTVGQFKIPFGFETQLSRFDLETINRSLVASGFLNNGFSSPYVRDIGLMVRGRYKIFQYKIAAVNGTGYDYQLWDPVKSWFKWGEDHNNSKDIVGWIGMGVPMFAGLGFSFYEGTWAEGHGRSAKGFDLHFDTGKVIFQYEYIRGTGHLDRPLMQWEWVPSKYSGYYILVGYRLTPLIEPTFKLDRYDPDLGQREDRQRDYYMGLNFNWQGMGRFQVFYRESKEAGNFTGDAWIIQTSARL